VIKAARIAEAAMMTVGQLAGGHTGELVGKLRVTSTDSFCQVLLPSIVTDLQRRSDGVFIELISANPHIDLALHQIDLAIRPTIELPEGLVGEAVATLGFAVYAAENASTAWLGLSGPLARSIGGRWMAENIPPKRIAAASDSFLVLQELAASGGGHAILPCFLGDCDPRLQRSDTHAAHFQVPIWIACQADQSTSPQLRLLRAAFAAAFAGMKARLLG
jgi:DNA-binding transcriptional LysR family regulator